MFAEDIIFVRAFVGLSLGLLNFRCQPTPFVGAGCTIEFAYDPGSVRGEHIRVLANTNSVFNS